MESTALVKNVKRRDNSNKEVGF